MATEQTSTFDLTRIQQAMGVRSRIVNPDVSEGVALVLTVGDMSKSFGSQKFEARGIASGASPNVAAEFGFLELHSIAPGGIVVEGYEAELGAGVTNLVLEIKTAAEPVATAGVPRLQTVGGQALTTTVVSGTTLTPPVATGAVLVVDSSGFRFSQNDLEWFVPSGSFAGIYVDNAALGAILVIRFREIPQAQGPQ